MGEGHEFKGESDAEKRRKTTERENTSRISPLEKWIIGVSGGLLFTIVMEVIVVLAVTFYRINISLFREDPQLFVRAINSFGSTYLQGALLGAGGIVAVFRVGPKLLSWARDNGYNLSSENN